MGTPQRFVAMFGQRASGKTVYIATLYGSSRNQADEGLEYHIEAAEEETHFYLRQARDSLLSGSWPDATPFDSRQTGQKMDLRLTVHGRAYQIKLPDIGGDLTRRLNTEADRDTMPAPDLKARILQELADYHGFLLFVPAESIAGAQGVEYKWEIDLLLASLKDRTPDGGMISRPVAVVVSKWDLRAPCLDGEVDHEARAQEFFESMYPEVASGLRATCKNVRVFPVSATGPLDGERPSKPLRPFNLVAPLVWLLDTSDRVMVERVRDYVNRNNSQLFRRDPGDPQQRTFQKAALSRLDELSEDLPRDCDLATEVAKSSCRFERTGSQAPVDPGRRRSELALDCPREQRLASRRSREGPRRQTPRRFQRRASQRGNAGSREDRG